MVDSDTVSVASGIPSSWAVRSSASSMALAIPLRRWVGATVTELIAHAGTVLRPGTVISSGQELTVATGDEASRALPSQTPVVRRSATPAMFASMFAALGSEPWNPRVSARSQDSNSEWFDVSTSAKCMPFRDSAAVEIGSIALDR